MEPVDLGGEARFQLAPLDVAAQDVGELPVVQRGDDEADAVLQEPGLPPSRRRGEGLGKVPGHRCRLSGGRDPGFAEAFPPGFHCVTGLF